MAVNGFDLLGDPEGGMFREADIDGDFRYSLKRTWKRGLPRAAWLMCNPSTADAMKDDPTIRRIVHFSKAAGCGSATVVNVWPLRTPYPEDLWPRLGDITDDVAQINMASIAKAAAWAGNPGGRRFVAFGVEPYKREPSWTIQAVRTFAARLAGLQENEIAPVVALGMNADGLPLHPLARGRFAIRNDDKPVRWNWPSPGGTCQACHFWSSWAASTGDCLAWAPKRSDEMIRAKDDARIRSPLPAACTWSADYCPEFEERKIDQ